MTFEEIKNEVTKASLNYYGLDLGDFEQLPEIVQLRHWPEICKRYAAECCKASLEKACTNMNHHYPGVNTYPVRDESNIVLK